MTVIRINYIEKNLDSEESVVEKSSVLQNNVNGKKPKELMINIDCPIGIVIDYVRKIAHLEGEVDLCEETTNQMKNVNSFPGSTRGTEILVPGDVYFIIKIDRDSEGRIVRILPMINNKSGKIAADIMSRIQAPPTRNKSTSLTGKITQEKIGGRNTHQEKRTKVGKPASRATEGQGR